MNGSDSSSQPLMAEKRFAPPVLRRRLSCCAGLALCVLALVTLLADEGRVKRVALPAEDLGTGVSLAHEHVMDAGARDLMAADVAAEALRQKERAADERDAADAWSPALPTILGPRLSTRGARILRRRRAQLEYALQAPENITWSPYHVILAPPGSMAHREGKFGTLYGMAGTVSGNDVFRRQQLWKPEWSPEPTGGGGFTLRMYGLNSDCRRGAGAHVVCPRKWIPHDFLSDWDDHGKNDRGGLHSWEGSAVVPDVSATSMGWFTGHIKGSSPSFLAVWWGQLPIEKTDDYRFCCSSARDGIRLFLNGKLLVDNDGRGSRGQRCVQINLNSGNHHIRVDGYQVGGLGGGTSKVCTYSGEDTGGSDAPLKSNSCCSPAVLPTPEGYSGIGYDAKARNANGLKGEYNIDKGGKYKPRETKKMSKVSGGARRKGSEGEEGWSVEVFVFYPWMKPLTSIPNVAESDVGGGLPPQSYLGNWKEGGPWFSCRLPALPIAWGDIDSEASGITMLPKLAPVAVSIGGNFEIELEGEYEFCGSSMMGGRLFVGSMKVMECDGPGPCFGCQKWFVEEGEHSVKALIYSSPAPAPLKFDLKYKGPDTKQAKKRLQSTDAKTRAALMRGGFRLYIFVTRPGSPAGMGWADPALGQVCTPQPEQSTPLKHPTILAPPMFCEFMFTLDPSKGPPPGVGPPIYCCYTPPWMEKQKPIMEAIVPTIEFKGLKDWMEYNPLQPPVMFGWVIYGAGLAQEAGSQTICIKTMAGARAWAGVDTWKNPKKPTVNNDGLKLQPFEKCGSVTTGKGLFPIKVDGFFNMGNPLLVVTHNGKVMHSFDNGIPKDTAVSVRSNKVYTLRQAQKVMNRAQKHAYKAAMLHQQLLEKRTVRLAAKRLQRAWLQSQTGQTHANNSRLESDFAPRHSRARRMLQLANKRSRRLRLLLESNLPRALDRGAAAVRHAEAGMTGHHVSGPGDVHVVEGVRNRAVFQARPAPHPRSETPRPNRPGQSQGMPLTWGTGWGFSRELDGLNMSQVHGENEAALRGWNQIEEEEFYREPPTYLQTEMAEFVPKKGVQNSGMDKSREGLKGTETSSDDATSPPRTARKLLHSVNLEVKGRNHETAGRARTRGLVGRHAAQRVIQRLRQLRHRSYLAQGRESSYKGKGGSGRVGGGWARMQQDLQAPTIQGARDEAGGNLGRGDNPQAPEDKHRDLTLEILPTLKVMSRKDHAGSGKAAIKSGRQDQWVYRGPNSEIAHAPTHERRGRGWHGPDQPYNFPGHWRYYKDTPARMATKTREVYTKRDTKNGPFAGSIPFWWTPNKFDGRGPSHHKRANHHTIAKDWYGRPTYDDKGNPRLPPSFYYDGVKEGEWHDGWEDYRRDFNEDAVPWNHNDPEYSQKPYKVQGWDKGKGVGEHSYGRRKYGRDDQGWQEPFHQEDVGIDDEGWARVHKDLTVRYESDFSPPFNARQFENADVSRVINGYNPGRWWPLWGKIVPYGDPLMVHHDLPTKRDWLPPGAFLASENKLLSSLWSKESEYELVMQQDGNLVLYHTQNAPGAMSAPDAPVWATATVNRGSPPYRLFMDWRGNLQIIDSSKGVLWSSGTSDPRPKGRERLTWAYGWDGDLSGAIVGNTLRLHQDGALVIHDRYGHEVWKGGIYNEIMPLYC